jgi:hypothetical protein
MFRRVALLWLLVPERQDAGAIASMIPLVNVSLPRRLTLCGNASLDRNQGRQSSGSDLRIKPGPCHLICALMGRAGRLLKCWCWDFGMLSRRRFAIAEGGTVSALNASVADNDFCDRRLERLHGGVCRCQLRSGQFNRVGRSLGDGAHRHAHFAAAGNRLECAALPIAD